MFQHRTNLNRCHLTKTQQLLYSEWRLVTRLRLFLYVLVFPPLIWDTEDQLSERIICGIKRKAYSEVIFYQATHIIFRFHSAFTNHIASKIHLGRLCNPVFGKKHHILMTVITGCLENWLVMLTIKGLPCQRQEQLDNYFSSSNNWIQINLIACSATKRKHRTQMYKKKAINNFHWVAFTTISALENWWRIYDFESYVSSFKLISISRVSTLTFVVLIIT